MTKKEERKVLDSCILLDGKTLSRSRMSEARGRVREGLANLPEWADAFQLIRRNGKSLKGRYRHRKSQAWLSTLNNYTQIVVDNLDKGLWTEVLEKGDRLHYTCRHGYKGERSIRNMCSQKVAIGGCPECLKINRTPVFGTLTRKKKRWEEGQSDPQAPCFFYLHRLNDGSFIYGVSAVPRLQHRMDQYKADMGYAPRIVYLAKATEREMWQAEDIIKREVTKGLKHDCEARRTTGGRTEYLPETYTTSEAVQIIQKAREAVQNAP